MKVVMQVKKIIKSQWFLSIFSTTLGVLLAFYLNEVNANRAKQSQKKAAIENIILELNQNLSFLEKNKLNDTLFASLIHISTFDEKIDGKVTMMPHELYHLTKDLPYVSIADSTLSNGGQFNYHLQYLLEMDLSEIASISWEATRMANLNTDFSYECLSHLINIYNIQEIFIEEERKILDAFVAKENLKMLRILAVVKTIKSQLIEKYAEVIKDLEDCK